MKTWLSIYVVLEGVECARLLQWSMVDNSKVAYDAYVYSAGTTNNENINVVLEYYLCFNNWSLCSAVPDWVKEFGSCVKISVY